MAAINIQLTPENPSYKNWVKAGLSLKVTRDGIQCFVDDQVQTTHQNILANICRIKGLAVGTVCNMCTTHNVLPCPTKGICSIRRGACNYHDNSDPLMKHRPCPNGICDEIYGRIVNNHRFGSPSWKNTDARRWCSSSWEVAKCFFPFDVYGTVNSAAETDFTGLVSLVINLNEFQTTVSDNLSQPNNLFCQVRNIRNQIMHTFKFELSDTKLNTYIDTMIQLLYDAGHLSRDVNAQNAIAKLNQIKSGSLIATAEDETQMMLDIKKHSVRMAKEDIIQHLKRVRDEQIEHIEQTSKRMKSEILQGKQIEISQDRMEAVIKNILAEGSKRAVNELSR